MSARILSSAVGGTLMLVIMTAAACSDDADPGPVAPPTQLEGGTTSEGGRAPDAASITPRPDLCEALTLEADAVAELELASDPPPPLGGEVLPGTYDLTELDVYAGPQPEPTDGGERPPATRLTGQAARGTLVVTEFELRFAEARGAAEDVALAQPQTRGLLYRVDGTSLVETAVCPTTALPVSVAFSAVGTGLAIFIDQNRRALYVRR